MISLIPIHEMWPMVWWNDHGHNCKIQGKRVLKMVCRQMSLETGQEGIRVPCELVKRKQNKQTKKRGFSNQVTKTASPMNVCEHPALPPLSLLSDS